MPHPRRLIWLSWFVSCSIGGLITSQISRIPNSTLFWGLLLCVNVGWVLVVRTLLQRRKHPILARVLERILLAIPMYVAFSTVASLWLSTAVQNVVYLALSASSVGVLFGVGVALLLQWVIPPAKRVRWCLSLGGVMALVFVVATTLPVVVPDVSMLLSPLLVISLVMTVGWGGLPGYGLARSLQTLPDEVTTSVQQELSKQPTQREQWVQRVLVGCAVLVVLFVGYREYCTLVTCTVVIENETLVAGFQLFWYLMLAGIVLFVGNAVLRIVMPVYRYSKALQSANTAFHQGNLELAMQACTAAIAEHPRGAEAYALRGYLWLEWKAYQVCIADSTSAIQYDPNQGQAYINRGLAYEQLGDMEQTLANYDAMAKRPIRKAADRYYMFNNRALTHYRMGNLELAMQDFVRAIPEQPENVEAYNNLSRILVHAQRQDTLVEQYTQLVQDYPRVAGIRYQCGLVYRLVGRLNDALSDFQACAALGASKELRAHIEEQIRQIRLLA